MRRNIQAALVYRNEDLHCRTQDLRNFVLSGLKEVLDANLADIFDEKNALKPVAEWPAVWLRWNMQLIKIHPGMRKGARGVVHLTLANRLKFLELMMRHLGMLGSRVKRNEDQKIMNAARAAQMRDDRRKPRAF